MLWQPTGRVFSPARQTQLFSTPTDEAVDKSCTSSLLLSRHTSSWIGRRRGTSVVGLGREGGAGDIGRYLEGIGSICEAGTNHDTRNHYLNSKHGREHAGGSEGTGVGEASGGKESSENGPGMKG